MDIHDPIEFKFVEVSFKSGATKEFYKMPENVHAVTGDMVVVDEKGGYNIGQVSLSGELVRLQMKKKRVREDRIMHEVIRVAHDRDLEKVQEAREREHPAMVKARAIARTLDLEMKVGDVEYRADLRKATFYYTAEGRVDFRELVRSYAREFRVKVEMRQIGARQESGRIGGLGPCGRELCCSTWLTDFKSVSTSAARYQNLSINQAKLSGQCGRLKCCLNYELDTYMEALKDFPKRADKLYTQQGKAQKIKMDIFKRQIYYMLEDGRGRRQVIALDVDRVKEILRMNKNDEKPETLVDADAMVDDSSEYDFESNVTGVVDLPKEKKRKKSRGRKRRKNRKKRANSKSKKKNNSKDNNKGKK
jgi:cell fate regulator YaaT (PSP1 superfamily)